jgi:cation:H+ antiporter
VTVILLLAGGLVVLVAGGELLVRGAVSIAQSLGVSPLMIGLTLVGFGTSTPELVTSIDAALADAPGVAVGNVIGSNICNILLILAVASLIRPVHATPAAFYRDGAVLAVATALGVGAALEGEIGRLAGAAFVTILFGYIVLAYLLERAGVEPEAAAVHAAEAETLPAGPRAMSRAALFLVGGLLMTLLGARWLVDGAVTAAQAFGISDAIIGLTVVAVGTSLPELVASVTAARRGQSDVAFGNIVGSNIYNVVGILGLTALVKPIPVAPQFAAVDAWVMVAATAALLVFTVSGWRINRVEGALMLAAYCAYVAWLSRQALAG